MQPNKELELLILHALAEAHPGDIDLGAGQFSTDERTLLREAVYLRQHGLIAWQDSELLGMPNRPEMVTITAAGIDYLLPDGGLGRELGIVTIRFEDSVIRDLLIRLVDDAAGEASVKSDLRRTIRALPAEGLKAISLKVFETALSHLPDAVSLLGRLLGLR